jgi:hypothetical protein
MSYQNWNRKIQSKWAHEGWECTLKLCFTCVNHWNNPLLHLCKLQKPNMYTTLQVKAKQWNKKTFAKTYQMQKIVKIIAYDIYCHCNLLHFEHSIKKDTLMYKLSSYYLLPWKNLVMYASWWFFCMCNLNWVEFKFLNSWNWIDLN